MKYFKSLCGSMTGKWFLLLCVSFMPSFCLSQVLNGSFEFDQKPSLDNWVIGCNDGESFQDAPGDGGMWCLGFLPGNLQGCYPRTAEQTISGLSSGDILEVSVWARQDEKKPSETSIYLKLFQGEKTRILSADTTTSSQWTQLTVVDTLVLEDGDSVAIVLDSGTTSGPDIIGLYSYFDLVEEKRSEQMPVSVDGLRPNNFRLFQNHPNPFNPSTTIGYDLFRDSRVVLKIYNVLGEEVRRLVDEAQTAGRRAVVWDGTDNSGGTVNSGLYIYRIETEDGVQNRRMLFLK